TASRQPSGAQAGGGAGAPGPITMVGTPPAAPVAPAPVPAPPVAPAAAVSAPAAVLRPAMVPATPPAPPPAPRPAPQQAAPSLDALPEEDRKLHEEARRFARLLVSEIVLYNERQVEEGRRQKDLYERLKEDIDRSRGMYDQRVSAKIRGATNYF